MRIHFFAPSIILFAFATLALPGCFTVGDDDAPSDDDDSCSSDAECLNGFSCQNDRCVANSGGTGGSTGGSGGKGGSSGGSGGKGGSTGGDGGTEGGSGGKGGSSGGTGGTEGGTGGTGGTEAGTGGDGGTGGSSGGAGGTTGGTGGSGAGTGGSSGSSATTPAKFCNALANAGEPVTLILDVGGVTISALTGACAPDSECIGVPVGVDVPVSLSDSAGLVSSGTYPEIPSGEEMVFISMVDTASVPTIEGFPGNGICTDPGSYEGTVARFCNKLTSGGASVTLTLDLDGATVSAATGECTPIEMCLPITSGTDVPIALLDGAAIVTSGTFPTIPAGVSMLFTAELDTAGTAPTITGGPYTGICGSAVAARQVGASGARKSADRNFVSAHGAFQVVEDSLVLDAAALGAAAGPRRLGVK